ncbi:MAG: oligosaccharide flippase family protein [Anaerolineaceae bacterium]|nr:oligosaccharide flippase family protein [Anaerolineaceae bacterium]
MKKTLERKHSIVTNVIANFLGRIFDRGIQIVLVPIQINLLGVEAFGLIGFFTALQGLLWFLDFGLTITTNREVARAIAEQREDNRHVGDIIRTFEIPYWLIGIAAGICLSLSAGWITQNWINVSSLSTKTVSFAVVVMGLIFVSRWPVSLYVGILHGLQRQVELNSFAAVSGLVRGFGSIVVLLIWSSVEAFFIWQLAAGILEITGYVSLTWWFVRPLNSTHPNFRVSLFKDIWRYALGVNIASLFGTTLGQADRLIVSKVLPLDQLGYYTVATGIVGVLGMLPAAIVPATTPKFIMHLAHGEKSEVRILYHQQTKYLAFIAAVFSLSIAMFAKPILLLWTRSEATADGAALPLMFIAVGAFFNIVCALPNQLSLAEGKTRPAMAINLLSGISLATITLITISKWQIMGAGFAWGLSQILAYLLWIWTLETNILPGESVIWMRRDTLPYLVLAGIAYIGGYYLSRIIPEPFNWILGWSVATFFYFSAAFVLHLLPINRTVLKSLIGLPEH